MIGCVAEGLVFGLRTNFFFVVLLAEEQSVHLVSADLYKGVEGGTGVWWAGVEGLGTDEYGRIEVVLDRNSCSDLRRLVEVVKVIGMRLLVEHQ
jgi:hypothetical protein